MEIKPIDAVIRRITEITFKDKFDLIVGIARGGIIPATLLQQVLQIDLEFLWLNFRNDAQEPQHEEPILLKPITFAYEGKSILLVDDRSNSGKTFEKAKEFLNGAELIKTCAVNGKSDYPLFDETCFRFPWRII
jgi:xanthine phosphoribosyltransferase